jgi:methanethiol S-methyltransferase
MKRWIVLLYGVVSYVLFLAVFLYAVGFIGGFATPTRLDGPVTTPLGFAALVNALLIAVFGLQHSVMARPGFKRWWTKLVPTSVERSTYVLASNLALGLLYWQWQPMGSMVWDLQDPRAKAACWALYAVGWVTVLITTFLINHFDLFGLRQVWLAFCGRPYTSLPFVMPGPYRYIRHPLYVGWLLTFWATPTMTAAHLVFAAGMTAYILVAIRLEERDLVDAHPGYAAYREAVPMFVPRLAAFEERSSATSLSETSVSVN